MATVKDHLNVPSRVALLVKAIDQGYDHSSWHGPILKGSLRGVTAAQAAFRSGAPGAYERGAVLERAAALVDERAGEFVRTMQMEAGFTVTDAGGEVRRCIQTLKLSAENLLNDQIVLTQGDFTQRRFTTGVKFGIGVSYTY